MANQLESSKPVIEHEQHARDHENHFRNFQIVARMNRHRRFKESNDVVADVTYGATDEMRNVRRRDELETCECLLKRGQRVAFAFRAVENDERIESDKREPTDLFVALSRFEKEARLAIVDLGESRDRCFHVRDKIDNQRNEIAAFRELAELVVGGCDIE